MTHNDSSNDRPSFELPVSRQRIGRAVDDELAFHLDARVDELVASGMDPESARRSALKEFGDLDSARNELRRIDELAARRSWASEAIADLGTDARRTIRALGRRPGYAIIAILTLALGIGANSAMFALVDRLLLSPPPHIRDADNVVHLRFDEAQLQSGRIIWVRAPYPFYRALARAPRSFDVAGSTILELALRTTSAGQARAATVTAVTPGYFSLLGTRPALGRFFVDGDAGDSRAAVISHALWVREFGAAEDVLGRSVTLGNEAFRIVGVAPRGFTGVRIEPVDAWIPLTATTPGLPNGWQDRPFDRGIAIIGRPYRGATRDAMLAAATQHYRASRAGTPDEDTTAFVRASGLTPGRDSDGSVTPESRVAIWLQGVSLLVLLLAVANVANLLLLRAIDRRRETGVSMALGVSRIRLVRQVVLESLALGTIAAVLAVVLTRWAGPVLWRVLLPEGAEASTTPWRDGAIVAALAVGSALAMTIVPAVLQLRTPANDALRSGSRSVSRRGSRMGDLLVIVQVACAVILLVGSGLFVRSLLRVADLDLGFKLDRAVAVQIDHTQSGVDSTVVRRYVLDAEARIRALPGVQSTAISYTAPYQASPTLPVFLPGHDKLPGVGDGALGYPSFLMVSPEFFATMGLSILQGRTFANVDAPTSPNVVIVDATMARTFWPNGNALGQCFRVGADTAPCRTVVGIVQDTRRSITGRNHALRYYLPIAQVPSGQTRRFVFVRTVGSPESMIRPLRAAATMASSSVPLVEVFPMRQLLDPYTRQWRLGRVVFVAFGLLATIIATIGLYGVIAFGVAQRRREFGIRIALGAPTATVLSSVVKSAGVRAVLGCLVGSVGAFVLGQRLRDLLFQTSATDVLVFILALLVVTGATLVACAVPAWRAVRVDPTVSLRAD
jgi:predicted permease